MRPALRQLYLLIALTLLALAAGVLRIYLPEAGEIFDRFFIIAAGVSLIALLMDMFAQPAASALDVKRDLPANLALGVANQVEISLENKGQKNVDLILTDLYPAHIEVEGLPLRLSLKPGQCVRCVYRVVPTRRGQVLFPAVEVLIFSRWKLWQNLKKIALPMTAKVLPNFTAISNFEMLVHDRMISQMGIHVMQRRGEGIDFHQLREFRPGDALRQVDWKATARHRKPISRQYQEERDQDIFFLLDSGRRMHARDGVLSHFDHALNALLLTAYVALRQGDAVGMMNFANSQQRRLSPVKGKVRLNAIIEQVYDLHSSTDTSDFAEAATSLMAFHRKRSLVILITNLREEDFDGLQQAVNLLSRRHLVMVASLREVVLDRQQQNTVEDFESALAYCASLDYLQKRRRMLQKLHKQGVVVVDTLPSLMHVALVNEYLALKRSGRI